jgi:hypothetical protein
VCAAAVWPARGFVNRACCRAAKEAGAAWAARADPWAGWPLRGEQLERGTDLIDPAIGCVEVVLGESTVRYLGVDVHDALAISEQTEI